MKLIFHHFSQRILFAAIVLLFPASDLRAHSGKARLHAIVDTDGAADDLRTLCMLLGNREIEVLAVTTSEGALTPGQAAAKVSALLGQFHHEGIPVGTGRPVNAPAPAWRDHSERIDWGDQTGVPKRYLPAPQLIGETLENESERVVYIALGTLTNLHDLLRRDSAAGERIERVIWYNTQAVGSAGANFHTDSVAARSVLASGIPIDVVSANPQAPLVVTARLLDTVATVPTVYARKIVATHRTAPLAALIDCRHLEAWDDLTAVHLFAPELFVSEQVTPSVRRYLLPDRAAADKAREVAVAILRGKPDAESRVFYGFPAESGLYAADVVPIIEETIRRHGPGEWRAGVLTNELHGHLGIYATIGVKMGIRAREYFNIGVDDIEVTTYAGHVPPVSCMNDGLQVGTGASVGHGLITVAENDPPRPEARFTFKGKTLRLKLKPEYARRISDDVRRGIELHGDLTEPYWSHVRELALKYWRDFDRHEIFEMQTENPTDVAEAPDRN